MKIDVTDGSVAFEPGDVKRSQGREDFLQSPLGMLARPELINKEWWHLHIKPEPGIAANVLFRGDRLNQVYILLPIPSDNDKDGWTEEHELERKAIHDAWLRRELGKPPYEYPWGAVTSEYDAKGCVSEIIVTYAP
jgi:hypothetical protein